MAFSAKQNENNSKIEKASRRSIQLKLTKINEIYKKIYLYKCVSLFDQTPLALELFPFLRSETANCNSNWM